MLYRALFFLVLCQFAQVVPVSAQTLTFGANQAGGPNYSIALAISKALGDRTAMDVRIVPLRSPSQALPMVNSNAQQLGVTSGVDLSFAHHGTGAYKGKALPELRAIGTLFPFRLTFAVRKDFPAKSIADLKGARIASGYRASSTGHILSEALLGASGLSFDDVAAVEATEFKHGRDLFLENSVDAVYYVVGSGENVQVDSQVGGIKVLGMPSRDDLDARVKSFHPSFRPITIRPNPDLVGIEEETTVLGYDYVLYTNTQMPDEQVAAIAETLINEQEALVKSFGGFRAFDPKRISAEVGIPYHPAALEVYNRLGLAPAQ